MAIKKKKAGRSSVVTLSVILFLPALIMIVFSKGCTSKFQELDHYGKIKELEWTDIYGKKITNKDLEGDIVLFSTIQNTCPDSCGINIWYLSEQIYQHIYQGHFGKLKHVRMISIVTDINGNPVKISPELRFEMKELVRDYDPKIWTIVEGDPRPVYDIENNGVNLYEARDSSFLGQRMFLESLVLVDWDADIRLVRFGKSESMIRDFYDGFTLLEKEYDKTIRNAKKTK